MFHCILIYRKANVKINAQTILAVIFIGFVVKACGADHKPRTVMGSQISISESSRQPISGAYTPAATPKAQSANPSTQGTILYVGPKTLNVRSSPNGKVNSSLKHGDTVEVYAEKGGWGLISKSGQPAKWVSTAHLCKLRDCSDTPKWKPAPPTQPVRRASQPASSSYDSPCSSGNNCYGPRGGRYCITSGGNKRYR